MSTPVAIAVVEHAGNFLIGQRPPDVPLSGLWEFPGGKIEPGESPEAAAVRECLEETGLAVEPLFRYPEQVQQYDHDRVQLVFIACRPHLREGGTLRDPFRWVPRVELASYSFPAGNRSLIEHLLSRD
jgi:mutator protein MutT